MLFVSVEHREDLNRNLAELSKGTVLDLPEQNASEEEARDAVVRWLNEHPGWLLIVDNLDTEAAVAAAEELLSSVRGGSVLFTGRLTIKGS